MVEIDLQLWPVGIMSTSRIPGGVLHPYQFELALGELTKALQDPGQDAYGILIWVQVEADEYLSATAWTLIRRKRNICQGEDRR